MKNEVNITNSSVGFKTTEVSNEDNNYSVYVHICCPNGETYFGVTNNIDRRWECNGCHYSESPKFYQAIQKYGWENIKHHVMVDGACEEDAKFIEGMLIDLARERGVLNLLNIQRSGGCSSEEDYSKEYQAQYYRENIDKIKQYYQENADKKKAQQKERYEKNADKIKAQQREYYEKHCRNDVAYKIYYRVRNYNKIHTPIETPLEAKKKYLEWGYIPSYIKNDDLVTPTPPIG